MVRKGPRTLLKAVAERYPTLADPAQSIRDGLVTVDTRIVRNPGSMVGPGSAVRVSPLPALRGEAKLSAALEIFHVQVQDRVVLDAGAAAGGFTRVLLDHGARRVYAVDVGHGQLLGSLRQSPQVVNLEATNLADLDRRLVPDEIELITLDLSYLSLTDAVPQLDRIGISSRGDLIALVKPMFELHLSRPPDPADRASLEDALRRASAGITAAGWTVVGTMESPARGSRGAFEFLIHARRQG